MPLGVEIRRHCCMGGNNPTNSSLVKRSATRMAIHRWGIFWRKKFRVGRSAREAKSISQKRNRRHSRNEPMGRSTWGGKAEKRNLILSGGSKNRMSPRTCFSSRSTPRSQEHDRKGGADKKEMRSANGSKRSKPGTPRRPPGHRQ